ncbi:MAG: dihydroneopterin aldolase [Candidatus Eremiobacteraeota bacterium]|nr:dihydroneopterin aldolase [Candidatus Eremiobacteraeota bacterium]
MDLIRLRRIRAFGRHGANPGERDREQAFTLDVELEIDLREAERSDDLCESVAYDIVHAELVACVADTSFALLERLAGELLAVCFRHERIFAATISIGKPGLLLGATPSVEMRRENPSFGNANAT